MKRIERYFEDDKSQINNRLLEFASLQKGGREIGCNNFNKITMAVLHLSLSGHLT